VTSEKRIQLRTEL